MTSPDSLYRTIRISIGCGLLTLVAGLLLLLLMKTTQASILLILLFFVAKISFVAGLFSLASVDFSLKKNTRLDTPAIRSKMRIAFILLLVNVPLGITLMTTALRSSNAAESSPQTELAP